MLDTIVLYIKDHYIELLGFAFGVAYVILATKQNIWCWPIGIINVLMYIIVFANANLMGDMSLQVFYLFMSIYAWYNWKFGKNQKDESIKVTKTKVSIIPILVIISAFGTFVSGYILTYTGSDLPYWDGLTTSLGLTATWMTAKKYIENWIVWVFNNLICVGVYFYKGLYPTMIFYFILAILAIIGYLAWEKDIKAIDEI